MEPNQDGTEVLETTVETVEETVETPKPERTAEQLAELEAKAAKADELEEKNKQLYERAKKAENKAPLKKDTGDLTSKDVLFLAKADIHEEDLDTVLEWAKFKKVPVNEAYKEMKSVLSVRAEERRTANATHTKSGARGTSKVSGEELLAAASRNEEIEATDENYTELFNARLARKLSKNKRR